MFSGYPAARPLLPLDEAHKAVSPFSEHWEKFDVLLFLKLCIQNSLSEVVPSIFTRLGENFVIDLLVFVAQMTHGGASDCNCKAEDTYHKEALQMQIRRYLMEVLPSSEADKPQLSRLRIRYAFALLEAVLKITKQPLSVILVRL